MVCEELNKFTNVDIEYLRKESKEKISHREKIQNTKELVDKQEFFRTSLVFKQS